MMRIMALIISFMLATVAWAGEYDGLLFEATTGNELVFAAPLETTDFDGRCPICKFFGLRSIVYEGGCWTTLLYSQPFYDEDGQYHHEDPNTTTCSYSCSNGHEFSTSSCRGKTETYYSIEQYLHDHDYPWIEPKEAEDDADEDDADMVVSWRTAGITFIQPQEPPSRWHRFWWWALLGIEYELKGDR